MASRFETGQSGMTDFDIEASRAIAPYFYRAPYPDRPHEKPHEYQHAGVEYAISREDAIIGDAPGVGKTLQGILVSNALEANRTLVVCPASLRLNWESEIWRWSTIENVRTYPVLKASDGISLAHDYVIISYDLLRNENIQQAILSDYWDHVILDEAHYLKDPKGNARTRFICAPDGLPSVTGRATALTGTLTPNQPIECYNIMRLLDWSSLDYMSLEDFRNTYYAEGGGMVRSPVWDDKKQANVWKLHWSETVRNVPRNLDDLQYRLRKHLMIRRLKEQVLHELPPKTWHPFPLSLTGDIREALAHPGWKQAEKLYELDPEAFKINIPIDDQVATARRLLGEAKAPAVVGYIEDLLRSGVEKVIVGAWHISVLHYLREKLSRFGLVYMDGSTSAKKRQIAVDQFNSDDSTGIALGQLRSMGLGWTLHANGRCQDAVLAEHDYVPGVNDQFLDRLHRHGQTGNVIGHVPVVPNSFDERILGRAISKDRDIYLTLDHEGG